MQKIEDIKISHSNEKSKFQWFSLEFRPFDSARSFIFNIFAKS